MGGFATTTWARQAGLLPPVGKDWEVELRLLTDGKMPGPISLVAWIQNGYSF